MLVKIPHRWEIPNREIAPEALYQSCRTALKALGFVGFEALGLRARESGGLYPAQRSLKYQLDRPIVPQWVATGYNNFYEFTLRKEHVKDMVGKFTTDPWSVAISGLVNRPKKYDFDDLLRRFSLEERLYRMRCVEAWSMAVPWAGFPISALIREVDPKPDAAYVRLVTTHRPNEMSGIASQSHYPWPYFEALRLDEAMNELALFATGLYGKPLPK